MVKRFQSLIMTETKKKAKNNMIEYPILRDLDGVYFRVCRNGKWCSICFSDLTTDERQRIIQDKDLEWMRRLVFILTDTLREIGDEFNIFRK